MSSKKNKKTKPSRLMWAYGSNLSPAVMRTRCPQAKKVGKLILPSGRLAFRRVADVELTGSPDDLIPGGLWEVTQECEKSLDAFEGIAGKFYVKRYMLLRVKGEERRCFFYKRKLDSHNFLPPSVKYYNSIKEGYKYFGLDEKFLEEALERAWDMKTWTATQRKRWNEEGRPRLARPQLFWN